MSDQEHTVETAGGMTIAHPASNRRFVDDPVDAEAMQRAPLDTMPAGSFQSSNVHSAIYDFGERTLDVRFKRDGPDAIYRYWEVPASEWDGLKLASSKGSYVNSSIAWDYTYSLYGRDEFPDRASMTNDLLARFVHDP